MNNQILLTREGFEKMNLELNELMEKKRPVAVERLRKAREMGDLSENSEYTAAKEDLAFVEGRIQEVEEIIKRSHVVENVGKKNIVSIGCKVIVSMNSQKESFDIVGELEADPAVKKLSSKSPIGKALIGSKIGEKVSITIPSGQISYEILDIQ